MKRPPFEIIEQRKREQALQQHLISEVACMLALEEKENLRWMGSTTDLMELLRTATLSGRLVDHNGDAISFRSLVRIACIKLHVHEPRNPRAYYARARLRKGQQATPYMERYAKMLEEDNQQKPFLQQITKLHTNQ